MGMNAADSSPASGRSNLRSHWTVLKRFYAVEGPSSKGFKSAYGCIQRPWLTSGLTPWAEGGMLFFSREYSTAQSHLRVAFEV
jgi:hypothetical protein